MVRLPASLERKLQDLFPRVRERERFVADAVEQAFEQDDADENPIAVGGILHLFTDGGSRGNPGQASIGCALEDPATGTILKEHMARIGIATNNVAEYQALIEGLKLALDFHPNKLVCHLDSELVVRQLSGEYRVKVPSLQPLVDEIKELAAGFAETTFVHIPRSDNHRADALVNKALDELPAPHYERPES